MTLEIEVREEIEARPTICVRDKVARKEIERRLTALIPRLHDSLQANDLTAAGRPYARYHNFGPVERVNVDLEVGLPLTSHATIEGEGTILAGRLPGGSAVVAHYEGPYAGIDKAYDALQAWIEERGYEAAAAPWESYLDDLQEAASEGVWRVDLVWPIKEGD
ncbi:MAG: GyrI-like domain-containing protein [Candidatus Promineifilaceae bacterium]|nr:GyrI-like domain-containing protein [Candidatus Promineifilaceae bacterium]